MTIDADPNNVAFVVRYIEEQISVRTSKSAVREKLQKRGTTEENITEAFRLYSLEAAARRQATGIMHMIGGAAWFVLGLAVTVVSYLLAKFTTYYVITTGAIVIGLLEFGWGVVQWLAGRALAVANC